MIRIERGGDAVEILPPLEHQTEVVGDHFQQQVGVAILPGAGLFHQFPLPGIEPLHVMEKRAGLMLFPFQHLDLLIIGEDHKLGENIPVEVQIKPQKRPPMGFAGDGRITQGDADLPVDAGNFHPFATIAIRGRSNLKRQ